MKKKFINLLYFGDFDCTTGFGMVSKNLIDNWSSALKDNGLISVFATNNYRKEAYNYKNNVYVIPAMNTREQGDDDIYARKSFLKLLFNGKYTHLFCLNDIEVINALKPHLEEIKKQKRIANKPSFKSLIYFPIDSTVRKKDVDVLSFFDNLNFVRPFFLVFLFFCRLFTLFVDGFLFFNGNCCYLHGFDVSHRILCYLYGCFCC